MPDPFTVGTEETQRRNDAKAQSNLRRLNLNHERKGETYCEDNRQTDSQGETDVSCYVEIGVQPQGGFAFIAC